MLPRLRGLPPWGLYGSQAQAMADIRDIATLLAEFAVHLRAIVSLEHVRRLLGHASITTTSRYQHLDVDDLTTAIKRTFDGG